MSSDVYLATITALQQSIAARKLRGQDTDILDIQLEMYVSFWSQAKGSERLEMFIEEPRDRYSAARAAMFFRVAADKLHEVGRRLEAQSVDPHAEVLSEAGIKDT